MLSQYSAVHDQQVQDRYNYYIKCSQFDFDIDNLLIVSLTVCMHGFVPGEVGLVD